MSEPDVSLELRLERTPASAGTDLYRFASRPLAGASFIEGRVLAGGWGLLRREASDEQGNHAIGRASVEINDDDGLVRGWLSEAETQFLENREGICRLHSPAGRVAGTSRSLFRGRVSDVQVGQRVAEGAHHRTALIELQEALGPYLDRKIPKHVLTDTDFPGIDPRLINRPFPLIGGEHSDGGSVDAQGNSTTNGMIPAIHVGSRRTVDDDPTNGEAAFLAAPVLTAQNVGSGGSTPYTYSITAHSAYGETTPSASVTILGPATLNATNYIQLTFVAVTGATGYTIYGRVNPSPVRRLVSLPSSQVLYNDQGLVPELPPGPPSVNTAQIEAVDGSFFWHHYVICLGVVNIDDIFGSDVAQGTSPSRVSLLATAGVDLLIPGYTGWPHGQNYLTTPSGLRYTGFYARGPRSQHHIDGVVTFAVQTCGYEDVGDGTGDSIQEAFPLFQHFLNEFVFKDEGETYRTGNWGPLEAFPSDPAVTMLQTSKFEACQDLTRTWLGTADGYYAAIYLSEQITVREFLQLFNQTFGSFTATNHHGQLYPFLIDDTADPAAGRLYRERIEIKRLLSPELDRTQIENPVRFQFDWDPDGQRYRSEVITIVDQTAADAQKGQPRDRGVRLSPFTRDFATAYDAQVRWHRRNKYYRRLQGVATNYHGVQDEPGDQIQIGHRDMIGDGTITPRAHVVLAHEVDPNTDEVTLIALDVSRILATAASLSPSASASPSVSPSVSASPSPTSSPSGSQSPSASVSDSPSPTPSASSSLSPSASVSRSVSPSASVSPSLSPSASQSPSHSVSPSVSPSPSISPSASQSPSASISPSASASPSEAGEEEVIIRKLNDTSRSGTTTLADDPHLLVPIQAGDVWFFEMFLLLEGSNTVHDFKIGFSVPSGTTMRWASYDDNSLDDQFQSIHTAVSPAALNGAGTTAAYGTTSGVVWGMKIRGWIFAGGTPGDVALQWAQNVSDAGQMTVKQESFIRATQVNA